MKKIMQEKMANIDTGLVMHQPPPRGPHLPHVHHPHAPEESKVVPDLQRMVEWAAPSPSSHPRMFPREDVRVARVPPGPVSPASPPWASLGLRSLPPSISVCLSPPGHCIPAGDPTVWLPTPGFPWSPACPWGDGCSPAHTPGTASPLRETRDDGPFVSLSWMGRGEAPDPGTPPPSKPAG